MMYDGPILDNHFHMNPQGMHVEAAKIFQKAGGTHLVLVHCPDFSQPPTTRKGHVDAYQKTIEMAESTRKLGLGVKVILGPHPAAFAHQFETLGEDAETNYWNSIDAALDFVQEQKAHGIGEVGRPHWPVSEDIWNRSNALLLETMKLAKKEDLPLQLHVEGDSTQTYAELAKMADKAGLHRSKLVRHYAPQILQIAIRAVSRQVFLRERGPWMRFFPLYKKTKVDSFSKLIIWMTREDLVLF